MRVNRKMLLLLVVVALLVMVSPALAQEHSEDAGPLAALGINVGLLISQLINFGIIFFLLTRFLWNPITNHLEARSAKISKGLEDASAAANARRNAEAEAEKILAQARSEASQIIEQGRARGEEVSRTVESDARSNADRIRSDARTAAAAERDTELAGLRGQVANIGVAIAQRLIGDSLADKSKQQTLINDFFTKVPEGSRNLSGDLEVVSAMPLDEGEQNSVRGQLSGANVTFSVDPSILGGLVIRSGDRVIDGSVRRSLGEMSQRLV
jgi:F-type H+-transporting ATPase subunit b